MRTPTFTAMLMACLGAVAALILAAPPTQRGVAPAAPPATQPAPLPTPADLKEMYDAGQFRTCLQQVARVLSLQGEAARHYDDYALLLLRGDCLLHLEDRETAMDAYTEAEKSPNPPQRAEARANLLLISASTGLVFTPKNPPGAPAINIVDPAKRKAAMLALFEQEKIDSKQQIDAALNADTLVPISSAVPTLLNLHALEVTATGSDGEIHPALAGIGEKARDLISRELTKVDLHISRIEGTASQPGEIIGGRWWSVMARRGLNSDDRESLRHDASYTSQITTTAGQCQGIAQSLGGSGQKWDPIIEQGTRVTQHARSVLMAE